MWEVEEEEQRVWEEEESWLWLASEQEKKMVGGTSGAVTEGADGRGKGRGQFKEWREQPEGGGWGLLGVQSVGIGVSATWVSLFYLIPIISN